MKPTEETIERAIKHLEYAAPLIPQHNTFGDDNRGPLDMQIRVLKERNSFLDFDDITEKYSLNEDDDRELYDAAQEAWDWLEGDFDAADGDLPATWDSFIPDQWTP